MFPVLVLVLGTLGLLAGLQARFRFVGLVGVLTAVFALLALLLLGFRPFPAINVVSVWEPSQLFSEPVGFRIDAPAWVMGLAVMVTTVSVFLTGLARGGGRRLAPRGATLLITAAALSAIFAADLVSLVIAWGALDLLFFLVLITQTEGDERQAVLSLGLNSAATLLAVAAAIRVNSVGGSVAFGEADFQVRATLLLTVAAIFRLGLFPLHLGLPVDTNLPQGLSATLRLIPAAVALMLLVRVAASGAEEAALSLRPWLTVAGVAALWVGAAQWWLAGEPRQGLPFVVLSQSGVVLLTGVWGGPAAVTGLIAQSLTLVLAGAVLFLYLGQEPGARWHAVLPGVAVAALAGVPFLPGFTGYWSLYTGLIEQGNYLVIVLIVAGQAILAAGLMRVCFRQSDTPMSTGPDAQVARVTYLAGLIMPLVFLLVAGVWPNGLAGFLGTGGVPGYLQMFDLTGLIAVALILVAASAGLGIWRYESELRIRTDSAWNTLATVTQLDWLYNAIWQVYRAGAVVLGLAAEILDGGGAVLWAVLVALVLIISFGVR